MIKNALLPSLLLTITWALAAPLARGAPGDPVLLKIQVVEGEGASYPLNSRATRGVTVLVSDETGRPVDGAIVSFMLPMDGPGGAFASGARSEIATTHPDGRAAAWGMRWNGLPGAFEIRITAAKGQARAGIVCAQYLTESADPSKTAATGRGGTSAHGSRLPHLNLGGHKWVWISLAVAGAAVAGAGLAGKGNSSQSSGTSGSGTVALGAPTITLGHP